MAAKGDTEPKLKKKEPVPDFKSREEEAEFWDTHDLADYWSEFGPAKVRSAKKLTAGLHIRLDPTTLAKLRAVAQQKGVGPTTLACMWILEHLQPERKTRAPH